MAFVVDAFPNWWIFTVNLSSSQSGFFNFSFLEFLVTKIRNYAQRFSNLKTRLSMSIFSSSFLFQQRKLFQFFGSFNSGLMFDFFLFQNSERKFHPTKHFSQKKKWKPFQCSFSHSTSHLNPSKPALNFDSRRFLPKIEFDRCCSIDSSYLWGYHLLCTSIVVRFEKIRRNVVRRNLITCSWTRKNTSTRVSHHWGLEWTNVIIPLTVIVPSIAQTVFLFEVQMLLNVISEKRFDIIFWTRNIAECIRRTNRCGLKCQE